ncbi:hypothetical protein GA0070622_0425 [Micromonospora sediminicola]|uniref:WD40-like Beta Propeller Repeat n=1 Tax=Micromonospora sediminicola TaxID=946078 RepID=A0A1A9B2X1_9ACTN|nr:MULTISPECIES: hypothetical protein [Micromonospora]SBT63473.1 hypothetical protein GA0070622_0425 [Micromonospora sediminicola]
MNVFTTARGLRTVAALAAAAFVAAGVSACGGTGTRPSAPTSTPSSDATVAVTPAAAPATSSTALSGTRYYLAFGERAAEIHVVRGDTDRVSTTVPYGGGECVRNTITISPYGERLAWVEGAAGAEAGTLVTALVDGSGRATIAKRSPYSGRTTCLGDQPLVWNTNDRLLVQQEGHLALLDLTTRRPADGDAGNETLKWWTPDGRNWAAVSEGRPYATNNGKAVFYRYTPPKAEAARHDGWRVRSVSSDGRYVAVGWINTDTSRNDGSFAVVDTTTGKTVDLPGDGTVRSILFATDGTVLVRRDGGITVLDRTFQPVGTVTEPAGLGGAALLAYVP